MTLELLEPVYPWQQWPRHYDPTEADLEAMSEEEYDAYWEEQCRWYNTQHLRSTGLSAWKVLWHGEQVGIGD